MARARPQQGGHGTAGPVGSRAAGASDREGCGGVVHVQARGEGAEYRRICLARCGLVGQGAAGKGDLCCLSRPRRNDERREGGCHDQHGAAPTSAGGCVCHHVRASDHGSVPPTGARGHPAQVEPGAKRRSPLVRRGGRGLELVRDPWTRPEGPASDEGSSSPLRRDRCARACARTCRRRHGR